MSNTPKRKSIKKKALQEIRQQPQGNTELRPDQNTVLRHWKEKCMAAIDDSANWRGVAQTALTEKAELIERIEELEAQLEDDTEKADDS